MREREPKEDTARRPVPLRSHRPLHAGQEHEPFGTGRDSLRLLGEQVVGVAEPLGLGPAFDRSELVAPPPQVATGDEPGVLEQPRVGVGVRMALDEHRRVLAGFARGGAHGFGRPHHVAHLTRLEHAGAERRGHLIPASDRDDRSGIEARRLRERGCDRRDGVRGIHHLRQEPFGEVDDGEHLGRPSPCPRIQQGEGRRIRRVDGHRAGDPPEHVRPGGHQDGRVRPDLGLLVTNPQSFEDRVRRVQVRADELVERLGRHPLGDRRRLLLGATIHPDHRRS